MKISRVVDGHCPNIAVRMVKLGGKYNRIVVASKESYDEIMESATKQKVGIPEPIKLYEMDGHQISRIIADYGDKLVLYKLEEILRFFLPGIGELAVIMEAANK